MKNKGGRPTKYKPELVQEVDKYLMEAIPESMEIPMVEGLALRFDVSKKTLYNWGDKYPEFLHALGKLKKTQKMHLTKIGIFGGKEINSNIVMLMLKVNHNMIETEKKIIEGGDKPIAVETKLSPEQEKSMTLGIAEVIKETMK